MKNIKINIILLFGLSFLISGCYTIIWTPEKEFPNESSYSSYGSGYYHYDQYYYYYDFPWWLEITPPSTTQTKYERDPDGNIGSIRNSGEGRGTDNTGRILETPPTTRSGNNGNETSTTTNSGSQTKERSSSGSTSTRESSNNSSDNVRNNDGTRNNNGRR